MNTIQIPPSPYLLVTQHRKTFFGCHDGPCVRLEHQQFEAMSTAFQPHGGFLGGDGMTHRLRRLPDQSFSTLERWLVSRKVLNLRWHDQTMIPLFQFDLATMAIRPACTRAVDELKAVFDDWELALWFATPNTWLDCAAPVALLASDEFAVLQAARADRFISRG